MIDKMVTNFETTLNNNKMANKNAHEVEYASNGISNFNFVKMLPKNESLIKKFYEYIDIYRVKNAKGPRTNATQKCRYFAEFYGGRLSWFREKYVQRSQNRNRKNISYFR